MPYFDENGQLVWTRRLTAAVLGGAVLLGVGAVVAHQVVGARVSEPMGMIATIALMLAVGGRATTAFNERWAGISVPPLARVRVRRGRVVITRRDIAARVLSGITGVSWALVAGSSAMEETARDVAIASAAFGPITILFLMLSFGSRVIVTPTEVVVCSIFTRRVIPRHLVGRLRGTSRGTVTMEVKGGREVAIGVGMHPNWSDSWRSYQRWNHRPAELKAAGRIQAALAAVAASPSTGTVVFRQRKAMIVLAALAVAAFMTLFVPWTWSGSVA